MMLPMGLILGFHVVATMYGFWLPNDPRGSGSDFVRADHLRKWGPATQVTHARPVAAVPHDIEVRMMAKEDLMYEPVAVTGIHARSIGNGFSNEIRQYGGVILACVILPTHTHLVLGPHRYDIRRFVGRLKGAATKQLNADGLYRPKVSGGAQHRAFSPSPWSRLPWVRYIWTEDDLLREIDYVEKNPLKEGKPLQHWSFVTPYADYIRRASHAR
jgi:REP element-mobilizing transposase RayT